MKKKVAKKCAAKNQLENMGYKILTEAKNTANGPDLHVQRGNLILRVEIKTARYVKRSSQVHPVEPDRTNDDLIAIKFPSGHVLIEPMKDHLKSCSPNGSRSFFGIY